MTRFLLVLAAVLAVAPAALADGPPLGSFQGGAGVLSNHGAYRYVALGTAAGDATVLAKISTRNGSVVGSTTLQGSYGIPAVAYYGAVGAGLSADGRTLVLADVSNSYPITHSAFLFLDPASLTLRGSVSLKGDFAFDALSPDGRRLYVVQYTKPNDLSHYVVRAIGTSQQRLLPGRIADREQKSWVMRGYPVDRVTAAGGRWVYTLYANPGGFPFVHALDTVRGVAHCIGLPWRGSANAPYNLRLSLRDGGRTLAVHWLSGRGWLLADTRTWRLSPDRGGGFPWWTLALAAPAAALILLLRSWRRAARRPELALSA
jgi:hypothetical protein